MLRVGVVQRCELTTAKDPGFTTWPPRRTASAPCSSCSCTWRSPPSRPCPSGTTTACCLCARGQPAPTAAPRTSPLSSCLMASASQCGLTGWLTERFSTGWLKEPLLAGRTNRCWLAERIPMLAGRKNPCSGWLEELLAVCSIWPHIISTWRPLLA